MNKKLLFLILLSVFVLPLSVFAQGGNTPPAPGPGGNTPSPNTPVNDNLTVDGLITAIVNATLFIASGIVVVLWVITGVLFLNARGAPEELKTARRALIAAVVGTIIVVIAVSAISLVKSALNIA